MFATVWLRRKYLALFWLFKLGVMLSRLLLNFQSFIVEDAMELVNFLIVYQYLGMQTLLCDVEDSSEKLDRFFSYNFLFFDDD